MTEVFGKRRSRHRPLYALAGALAVFAACAPPGGPKPNGANQQGRRKAEGPESGWMSASNYLSANELGVFQPSRSKKNVLSDIQWRGAFLGACEHEGKSLFAIQYIVLPDETEGGEGISADAIFIDDEFTKFVAIETGRDLGIQKEDPEGKWYSVPIPRRLDDCRWLIKHVEHSPLDVDAMRRQLAHMAATSQQADAGPYDFNAEDRRNVELRDQFNASRLRIGMAKADVRATFKAEPLEVGKADSGEYEIYGSNEILNLRHPPFDNYANALVLYRNGKSSVILPVLVNGDYNYRWRQRLSECFSDLGPPGASAGDRVR